MISNYTLLDNQCSTSYEVVRTIYPTMELILLATRSNLLVVCTYDMFLQYLQTCCRLLYKENTSYNKSLSI